MKTIKLLAAIAATAMMSACSQEEILLPENNNTIHNEPPTRVSLAEALKRADRMLEKIGDPSTRSSTRTVKSVQFIGGSGTRAEDDAPMYYVVNYENEGGFAVLGADTRLDGVYAISDQGHLDMNDTTFNFGLNVFFRSLPPYKPYIPQDSIDKGIHEFQPIDEKTTDLSYQILPLLSPAVRKWSQHYPYSTFCPMDNWPEEWKNGHMIHPNIRFQSIVGCTAVAVGQIMSYYECPKTYGQYTFDWSVMKAWLPVITSWEWPYYNPAPEGGVARLLRELGKEGNLKVDYHWNGSGADLGKHYKRTFKTFEYNEPGDFKTFSTEDLRKLIYNKKPVLVKGKNDKGEGHAWVVDGLYCDSWKHEGPLGTYYYGDGLFFHIVWGWGGSCNGYFKHGSGFTQVNFKYGEKNNDPTKEQWDNTIGTDNDWYENIKIYKLQFCGDFNPR